MNVAPGEILTVIGGVSALTLQAIVFGVWCGRLAERVTTNHEDIQGLGDRLEGDLLEAKAEIEKDYKAMCNAKQETWQETMKGLAESRGLITVQNSKEHRVLFDLCKELAEKVDELTK